MPCQIRVEGTGCHLAELQRSLGLPGAQLQDVARVGATHTLVDGGLRAVVSVVLGAPGRCMAPVWPPCRQETAHTSSGQQSLQGEQLQAVAHLGGAHAAVDVGRSL